MIEIREIHAPEEKARICSSTLLALPDWFGIESAFLEYVEEVQGQVFYAAFDADKAIGFAAIKPHSAYAAEVSVMGILPSLHRQGIGQKLIAACETYAQAHKFEFLSVKTVDESADDDSYAKTRAFYRAQGFKPLEVFPTLWDENNPCLIMVKTLGE